MLQYLDKKYKSDYEIVLEAVTSNSCVLQYAYLSLQNDKNIRFILDFFEYITVTF